MRDNDNEIWNSLDYVVVSVKKTTPPDDISEGNWYEYIVGRSNSCMICKRRGTLNQVTKHAENLAIDLNSRRIGTSTGQYGRNIIRHNK